MQPPGNDQPPGKAQGTKSGHGRGTADSIRGCATCRKDASEGVLKAGHDCSLYTINIGKDPGQYAHSKNEAVGVALLATMEQAQAQEQLAAKKMKSVPGVKLTSRRGEVKPALICSCVNNVPAQHC